MSGPWDIYHELIDGIPGDVIVTASAVGLRWCRVVSSERGTGMAYTIPVRSRRPLYTADSPVGAPLREIAALAKSWDLVEAGLGMAAINAWYGQPERASQSGFTPCAANSWEQVFHPYSETVAGKVVSVIGHFPFAPPPLQKAAELRVLERDPHPGDYPDPACEYLLPDSDFVFISGSAFVNKTMPRLLHLARNATTIVLGPSTPLSAVLFDHGADVVTGFVASSPTELCDSLGGLTQGGMYDHAYRVERRGGGPADVHPGRSA